MIKNKFIIVKSDKSNLGDKFIIYNNKI
jgi:hypothetical protein